MPWPSVFGFLDRFGSIRVVGCKVCGFATGIELPCQVSFLQYLLQGKYINVVVGHVLGCVRLVSCTTILFKTPCEVNKQRETHNTMSSERLTLLLCESVYLDRERTIGETQHGGVLSETASFSQFPTSTSAVKLSSIQVRMDGSVSSFLVLTFSKTNSCLLSSPRCYVLTCVGRP